MKGEKLTRDYRKLHNEELHNLFSSNIIRVNKSRSMRRVDHTARMAEMRNAYILVGGPDGKIHYEDLSVDGIIFK
jgi:hypothetical protein